MLVKKVKLVSVGDPVSYQKRENNTPVKTPDGQDVVGYRRQLVFESKDFKKDVIPIMAFNDSQDFPFRAGDDGELQFMCELREPKSQEGETRFYPEFRLINFIPS